MKLAIYSDSRSGPVCGTQYIKSASGVVSSALHGIDIAAVSGLLYCMQCLFGSLPIGCLNYISAKQPQLWFDKQPLLEPP